MSTHYDTIREILSRQFGDRILAWEFPYGMLSLTIQPEFNLKALTLLYDDPDLGFQFLTDLTGVHYPEREGQELAVVYHLHNLVKNVRIRMKIYVPVAKPDVYTATGLFSGANWMERETYDFLESTSLTNISESTSCCSPVVTPLIKRVSPNWNSLSSIKNWATPDFGK